MVEKSLRDLMIEDISAHSWKDSAWKSGAYGSNTGSAFMDDEEAYIKALQSLSDSEFLVAYKLMIKLLNVGD